MSVMGVRIDQFDVPVCTSFNTTILNDQLCYEVDPNEFVQEYSLLKDFKKGLIFYVDTNLDRQYPSGSKEENFMIYLDTLGRLHYFGDK